MSSLKIILADLEKKTTPALGTLKNKLSLNESNDDCDYAEYEKTDNIFPEQTIKTNNNFVNAFIEAYNSHLCLRIRPDDIKLQLLMIISTFVNNNAEKMRKFFVDHEGKQPSTIQSPEFSGEYFLNTFGELLEQNIKCPEFAQHFRSKFTTTTRIVQTVNSVTLMNTLKEYFEYSMILGCGIPSIILDGTQEDWQQLRTTYEYFKSLTIDSELKDWYTHFDVVFNMFIEMRMLKNDGIVDKTQTPEKIKKLFERVVTYIPYGSGSGQTLGGWVRLFCPYTSQKTIVRGLDKQIECLNIDTKPPSQESGGLDYYDWQRKMSEYYLGGDWNSVPESRVVTPASLSKDGGLTFISVEFNSGFFPPSLNKDNEVEMNVGYLMRADQNAKDERLNKNI